MSCGPLPGSVRPRAPGPALLVPFAFGLVVLVPPMFYIGRLGQPAFHQPYWQFWLSFVNVPALARGLVPRGSWTSIGASFDPAHLWFLYVLLLFTLALLPLFYLPGRPAGQAAHQRTGWFRRAPCRRRGAGSRDSHDGGRGGVRTGRQHRRLGTRGVRVPVLLRVPDRLRPPVGKCAAALALGRPGNRMRGDRTACVMGGRPEPIKHRPRRQRPARRQRRGLAGWAWIIAIIGFAGSIAARQRHRQHRTVDRGRRGARAPWRRARLGTATEPYCCFPTAG